MISNTDTLISRIADGDEKAFKQLFDSFNSRAIAWANYYLKSHEIAEEVVSDVFMALWRKRKSIQNIQNLQAYIYMAVRNGALQQLRLSSRNRTSVQNQLQTSDERDNPENIFVDAEYVQLIQQGIDALPNRCRQVFTTILTGRLKQNETAQLLGISVKTVEAQVAKAYKRIATHVKGQYNAGV